MGWRDIYESRLMSAAEAAKLIQNGDCFWTPLLMGQPSSVIMDAIADRKDELQDVEYISCLALRPYKIFQPEYRKAFPLVSAFYSSAVMKQIAKSEWANYLPNNGATSYRNYTNRKRVFKRRTGYVLQVAPPDANGFVNLGLDSFYTEGLMDQSEWVIAQVNPLMPRTYGRTNFHVSRFSAFVEHPEAPIAVPTPEASPVEKKIAEHVVSLLKDRDCIQVGIGAVPAMISKLLEHSGLRDLGIHSEMVPDGTHRLVDKGVVTCSHKQLNAGKILAAFTMGDAELYEFVSDNPMCEFHPTFYTNHIPVIAQEKNVVAINGSIEVDLTGQITSESIGDTMVSGSGGQLDFVIGAFLSDGGRAINLVPSTTANDEVSRIVPFISDGARVTVPRHYAGYVVTEYGIADLYGRTEPERAEALINIAHPKFREELEISARKRGLLKRKYSAAA